MTAPFSRQIILPSPDATARLAAGLAARLSAGDVLLLEGPIGAGKTHFARALIQARLALDGAPVEEVPSPTFTLVQTYDSGRLEIWHCDLYRLTHPDEIEELGLTQAFDEAICLVEWPDRLGSLSPEGALTLEFAPGPQDDARLVRLASSGIGWGKIDPVLAEFCHD